MKHAVCTLCVTVLFTLSSCSHDYNGHYTGYISLVFGLLRVRIVLTVDDETATLHWPDGSRLLLQVARHGDRLVLFDARGDALTFHVLHEGDTLRCAQCNAVQLPNTWERQRGAPRPVETGRPPRGRRAGQAEPLDASE